MDKQTLSNYGWVVVLVLILAVLLALATPFGSFVSTAIKDVTGGFWDVNSASLNAVGLDTGDIGFDGDPASCGVEGHYIGDDKGEHGIPVEDCDSGHTYTCECDGWIVPDGGKYYIGVTSTKVGDYTGATKVYNAGETLPCGYVPVNGDTYVDKDYEYKYGNKYASTYWSNVASKHWGVRVIDNTKSSYGKILDYIVNHPVADMDYTFDKCSSLITAPEIPSNVTSLSYTFRECKSLTKVPTIPNKVKYMRYTFSNCKSLTTPPDMSKATSVTNMQSTFSSCELLTTTPVIPISVTNMNHTFAYCSNLTTATTIPNSVTNMYGTFAYSGLIAGPKIPSSVTNMEHTFYWCTSLITPPDMSEVKNLKNMNNTFNGCPKLTKSPIIPDSVISLNGTFKDCQSLISAPVIPNSATDMSYTFSGCYELKVAPTIPNSVTNMTETFAFCKSLSGTIEINANPTSYNKCFYSVWFNSQNLKLKGASSMLDTLGSTGYNYCSICNGTCSGTH